MLATIWQQLPGDIGLALPSERGNPWPPFKNVAARRRVIFRFRGLQHFVTIGEVEETEAQGVKARYEYLLRLLKQRLLTLPSGMDIVTFLRLDGKPGDPLYLLHFLPRYFAHASFAVLADQVLSGPTRVATTSY